MAGNGSVSFTLLKRGVRRCCGALIRRRLGAVQNTAQRTKCNFGRHCAYPATATPLPKPLTGPGHLPAVRSAKICPDGQANPLLPCLGTGDVVGGLRGGSLPRTALPQKGCRTGAGGRDQGDPPDLGRRFLNQHGGADGGGADGGKCGMLTSLLRRPVPADRNGSPGEERRRWRRVKNYVSISCHSSPPPAGLAEAQNTARKPKCNFG